MIISKPGNGEWCLQTEEEDCGARLTKPHFYDAGSLWQQSPSPSPSPEESYCGSQRLGQSSAKAKAGVVASKALLALSVCLSVSLRLSACLEGFAPWDLKAVFDATRFDSPFSLHPE